MKASKEQIYIYGRQPVLQALRSAVKVEQVWLAKNLQSKGIGQIIRQTARRSIPLKEIPKNDLQQFVGSVVHQGVVALVQAPQVLSSQQVNERLKQTMNPLILILDQIQDPHNLGAILRTAEISAVDLIVLPVKGSAELNATVAKTSAGAMFNLTYFVSPDLTKTIEDLRAGKIKIVATMPASTQTMYETDLSGAVAILIGNEGRGVRKHLLSFCDQQIAIPQFGKLNSLNASVSTGVVLFEAVRQRHFPC